MKHTKPRFHSHILCVKFSKNNNVTNQKAIFAIVHKLSLIEESKKRKVEVEEPLGHVHQAVKLQNTYNGKINTIKQQKHSGTRIDSRYVTRIITACRQRRKDP